MPSASTLVTSISTPAAAPGSVTGTGSVAPTPSSTTSSQLEKVIEQTLDPFRQAITVLEHKVRNLEKRKGKLDSYKQEQEQGKELNADQLTAVAKYNEVAQQLDLAREMMKQLAQIQTETCRSLKKQQKKDQAERAVTEYEKYKQLLVLQSCLRHMSNPTVRSDFQLGKDSALSLTEEEFAVIDELIRIASLELSCPDFQNQVHSCAEQLLSLCEEKSTILTGQMTFKDAKTLLLNISKSGYFDPNKVVYVEPEPVPEPEEPIVEPSPPASVIDILSAQTLSSQTESTYQFIQESQIDIESPHMDPAVVAVSSFAPPLTQRVENNSNVFITGNNSGLNTTGRIQTTPGGLIDDLNLNHLSIKGPEEYNETWDSCETNPPRPESPPTVLETQENNGGEGDSHDLYERSGRGGGGFRRGGPRLRVSGNVLTMNGYRGGPRVPSRGGYQNGRGNFQAGYRGRDQQYFQGDRYEREELGREERGWEREDRFDREERYDRSGERFDRGGERFERFERGDNDMGEFRAPRTGPRSGSGVSAGGFGNRVGNPYGGQRGMVRGGGGIVRGGQRPFRGGMANHGPTQGSVY